MDSSSDIGSGRVLALDQLQQRIDHPAQLQKSQKPQHSSGVSLVEKKQCFTTSRCPGSAQHGLSLAYKTNDTGFGGIERELMKLVG